MSSRRSRAASLARDLNKPRAQVPTDPAENAAWRLEVLGLADRDEGFREGLLDLCAEDPVFWFNGFCWTYDPRLTEQSQIPFILFECQEEWIDSALANVRRQVMFCCVKSRDMGVSWMSVGLCLWITRFDKVARACLMASRNEDYVDDSSNPKSLFWKVDFTVSTCPGWMFPTGDYLRQRLKWVWHPTGSTLDGESTTGDLGRGDRRYLTLLDEAAFFQVSDGFRAFTALQQTSPCRMAVSTPNGVGNAFHVEATKATAIRVDLGWWQDPRKNEGAYQRPDGKWWGPWREAQESEFPSAALAAQELDLDFLGSGSQFYQSSEIQGHIEKYARDPIHVGFLDFDRESSRPIAWEDDEKHGFIKLWFVMDPTGWPPADEYAVACDIGAGTGATPSVASIVSVRTGEKVAEIATARLRPEKFAELIVAVCRWFRNSSGEGAHLVWEAPGPGRQFGDAVLDRGYRKVWLKRAETNLGRPVSQIPGWWPTKDERGAVHSRMRKMLQDGRFVNRSLLALQECYQIVFRPDGWIINALAANVLDPSGAADNHADRPTADALACMLIDADAPSLSYDDPAADRIPVDSFAWRREEHRRKQQEAEEWQY